MLPFDKERDVEDLLRRTVEKVYRHILCNIIYCILVYKSN